MYQSPCCIWFGDTRGPKPYKFIWFGGIRGPKPYKFIWFGGIRGPKPYKFIWFGGIRGPKPYKFIWFGDIRGPKTSPRIGPRVCTPNSARLVRPVAQPGPPTSAEPTQ